MRLNILISKNVGSGDYAAVGLFQPFQSNMKKVWLRMITCQFLLNISQWYSVNVCKIGDGLGSIWFFLLWRRWGLIIVLPITIPHVPHSPIPVLTFPTPTHTGISFVFTVWLFLPVLLLLLLLCICELMLQFTQSIIDICMAGIGMGILEPLRCSPPEIVKYWQ